MHAASVHPEPGSNSRKYCIKSPCGVSILSSSFCSSFTFVWVVFSFRIDRDFSSHFFVCFVLISCCSIFNDRLPPEVSFFLATRLLYHIVSPLSSTFSKVFSTFFRFLSTSLSTLPRSLPRGQLSYSITFFLFCQPFFRNFFLFVAFLSLYPSLFRLICILRTRAQILFKIWE